MTSSIERTNSDRARRAWEALEGYSGEAPARYASASPGAYDELLYQDVKDCLTDLMHLCDRMGWDGDELMLAAELLYNMEVDEDEPGEWAIAH